MAFQSKSFKGRYGKSSVRSAADYGIPELDDAVLQELASNPGRYGEKSRYASQELGARKGLYGQADAYRAALERATYQDAARQYGAGLGQISSYLARSGPLADSGAGTALRARLASQIYGQASGRIGTTFANYLGTILNQRRQYNYQRQLMAYQRKLNKRDPLQDIAAAAGGIGGSFLGGGGYGGGGGSSYFPSKFGEPD